MIKVTMQCYRCSKKTSYDIVDYLDNDIIRSFGFIYVNHKGKPILICIDCKKKFEDFQKSLQEKIKEEECDFFETCERTGKNGNKRGNSNGRSGKNNKKR